MRHNKSDVSVVFVEAAMLREFRSTSVNRTNFGNANDVRRARIVGRILIREGEKGAGQPLADAGIPGKTIERGDSSCSFSACIVLEPNQDAIIPDVEGEIGSNRSGDHCA